MLKNIFFVILFFLSYIPLIANELTQITVEGRAEFISDEQTTYEAALDHALRLAVEEVLGTVVSAQTIAENSTLLEDKIYSKSSGFVKKYEVLKEYNKKKIKYISIKAWVIVDELKENALALNLLQDRANRPLVAVWIVGEKLKLAEKEIVENAIKEGLKKKQFDVIDSDRFSKGTSFEKIDKIALRQLAKDNGVQILVLGELSGKLNDTSKNTYLKNSSLKSVTVSLSLKAFTVDDDKIVASTSKSIAKANLSYETAKTLAAKRAGILATEEITEKIISTWDDFVNNGFEYTVFFKRVSFSEVQKISFDLNKNIAGVKAVFKKQFKNKKQKYLIRYTGNLERLAIAITDENFSVPCEVIEINNKVLTLEKK